MPRRQTLRAVAATGDRVKTLEVLRDRLAGDIDECRSARDVAALSNRLLTVLAELGKQQPRPRGRTPLDEMRERRSRAQQASQGVPGDPDDP